MEPSRKRVKGTSSPQPGPRQVPTGQSSSATPAPGRTGRSKGPPNPNALGRPRKCAAPANLPSQGQGPILALGQPLLPAVGETPNLFLAPLGGIAGTEPPLMNQPVPAVTSPHPGPASAAGEWSGRGELPATAPAFTAADVYVSGSGTDIRAPPAFATGGFNPKLLMDFVPGLGAWGKTAGEAPTATPAQGPAPYHHTVEMELNLKFLGVRTGGHHGRCTPGRHHQDCTARSAACAAVVSTRAAVQMTLVSRDFLERNGLRWVPDLEQHGGPGSTKLVAVRESGRPCEVTALVVDGLAPGVDVIFCHGDAGRLGYDLPALEDGEHTLAPLENQVAMDSMPVDTGCLPYPHHTSPAPPVTGLEPWNSSGIMSATGSLGGAGPGVPSSDDFSAGCPPQPPSTSGPEPNFTAAADDPYVGYDPAWDKEIPHENIWDWVDGGGDNHHRR